jgi:hypothetical protein
MNAEIVFTGLCSFLNPSGTNPKMPGPSVILVQTKRHPGHGVQGNAAITADAGHQHAAAGLRIQNDIRIDGNLCTQDEVRVRTEVLFKGKGDGNVNQGSALVGPVEQFPMPEVCRVTPMQEHVAYIAYKAADVQVDDPSGFLDVPNAAGFKYLPLDGHEIAIEGNAPGTPDVQPRYHQCVPKKDVYWPESIKDKFDPDYVPPPGSGLTPKKSAVVAYMRFGNGKIDAGRAGEFTAQFKKSDGMVAHQGEFAEEVIYSDFPHTPDHVKITLSDLETGAFVRSLDFTLVAPDRPLRLFIGNHPVDDIDLAVRQQSFGKPAHGCHFAFLNAVAGQGAGPIPMPFPPPADGIGGGAGALCGPGHANG